MDKSEANLRRLKLLQEKHHKGLPLSYEEMKFVRSYVTSTDPSIFSQNYPSHSTQITKGMAEGALTPSTNKFGTIIPRKPSLFQIENELIERYIKENSPPGFSISPTGSELSRLKAQARKTYNALYSNLDEKNRYRTYDPSPGISYFTQVKGTPKGPYISLGTTPGGIKSSLPHSFVSLDIETSDFNKPISISALKFIYNTETLKYEQVDSYQRYYKEAPWNLIKTYGTHELTPSALRSLRKQQIKAGIPRYSSHYDAEESQKLLDFIGVSTIVGHNIIGFDLPTLFPGRHLPNSTIDTLIAARNIWKDVPNGLDDVFKRLFGKSMSEAGLGHHDANADTIASLLVAQAIALSKQGADVRAVMRGYGLGIGPREEMLGGITITKDGVNMFYPKEAYMTPEEIKEAQKRDFLYEYDDAGNRVRRSGIHEIDIQAGIDIQKDISLLRGALAEAKEADAGRTAVLTNNPEIQALREAMSSFSFWKKGTFTERLAHAKSPAEEETLMHSFGFLGGEESKGILHNAMELRKARNKQRVLDALEGGRINKSQADDLLAGSMDDLSGSLDDVIAKNQKLLNIYTAIARVPMYNFERLEKAFLGEVSGIKGAARGIIPSSIYSPLSRLTDAGMNALKYEAADWKGVVRAGSAIGGPLMSAGIAAMPEGAAIGGPLMAAGGIIKAGTQLYGNYKEASITRWGEGIQNNLNTLGFIQDTILLPFRLLKDTVNKAVKGLGLFSNALKLVSGSMGRGLESLTQMGNPLTGLTGVNYGNYMGTLSVDAASLMGRGTLNSLLDDFATQRALMYSTGSINTDRLVAASILGVFNDVYGYSANEPASFSSMIDTIAASLKGQSPEMKARTFALAKKLGPGTESILQTMDTLGITSFSELQSPRGMLGYSEAQYNRFRPGWQRSQWEYQYAGLQKETSMQRISTGIWNAGGKNIYNAYNAVLMTIADAFDSGNWESVATKVKELWTSFREGANSTWEIIKKVFGIEGSFKNVLLASFDDIGIKVLKKMRDDILPALDNVWDQITGMMLDKMAGVVSFLSTIKINSNELMKALMGKKHGDILTYLGDTRVGKGPFKGEYHPGQESGFSLHTLGKVASMYDKAMGKAPVARNAYTGSDVYGVAQHTALEHGYERYYSTYEDYVDWLTSTLASASPDDLDFLNGLLQGAGLMEQDFSLDREANGEEFINFLLQREQNAAGASVLHRQWGTRSDITNSTVYKAGRELLRMSQEGREYVEDPLINAAINALEEHRATLDIKINDKTVSSMSVSSNGAVAIEGANNSMVNVVQGPGDAIKYMLESVTKIVR